MTGLEKMVERILEEARTAAREKIEEANSQAAVILEDGEKETTRLCGAAAEKTKAALAASEERSQSAIDLMRRTEFLKTKQELIRETLDKACETFCSVEGEEYYRVMEDMAGKFVRPEAGVMLLSPGDYEKAPADFAERIEALAKKAGGSLRLEKAQVSLDKGFILSYGGIEENCSFKALFADKKDELQDQVSGLLFS
jgi:V/A-type H+-transporting ATPase subunit E